MNPIICLAGPTASGKTALAVALAQALNGEVVSCDSMQVYKFMDIGTAKPTLGEMQGVPHRMIDVADPREDYSVSRYCKDAAPIVEDIVSRGKVAIIAGGTGLYMDSLIRGNDFAPFPSTGVRERLERQADAEGLEAMRSWLRSIDPEAEGRIQDLRFYGDFLSLTSQEGAVEALRGTPYRRQTVKPILESMDCRCLFGNITEEEILETMFPTMSE